MSVIKRYNGIGWELIGGGGSAGANNSTKIRLAQSLLTTTLSDIVAPVSVLTRINEITLCNITGSIATVDLALTTSVSASTQNYLFKTLSIQGNTTVQIDSLLTAIPVTGHIQAVCNTSNAVSVLVSGDFNFSGITPTLTQTLITDTMTNIYSASGVAVVRELLFCNTSGNILSMDVALIPSGETLASKNYMFKTLTLNPYETKQFTVNIPVVSGDTIQAKANATGYISASVSCE